MKKDITSRSDIKLLVDRFYQKVFKDDLIKHFFLEVIDLNTEEHMPIMYDFWESMLLDKSSYTGNPMIKHLALNQKSRLEEKHFVQWKKLFHQTLDELFIGNKAEEAKKKADAVSLLMMHKINNSEKKGYIQ